MDLDCLAGAVLWRLAAHRMAYLEDKEGVAHSAATQVTRVTLMHFVLWQYNCECEQRQLMILMSGTPSSALRRDHAEAFTTWNPSNVGKTFRMSSP